MEKFVNNLYYITYFDAQFEGVPSQEPALMPMSPLTTKLF